MAYGKSIELFLVNGTADSLITAELSNWNGKALKIPRIEVPSCNRTDFMQPGVYLLFCKDDNGEDAVYIGEAENVKDRLMQHLRDYQSEKERYYWNCAVVFTGRDLNKALIRYLEYRLVEIARNSRRYRVLTKNTCRNTVLKEAQIAAMEEFIEHVKILINTLGYKVLEPVLGNDTATDADDEVLMLNSGKASAKGKVTTEGFVVMKGSQLNEITSERTLIANIVSLRQKYAKEGKIRDMLTMEDLLFSSASAAAGFVLGYNVSGPVKWKNREGRTLKELEQMQTEAE